MSASFLALTLLLAAAPAWTSTEETEAGQRLTIEATEFLDQLLGPGRAKVLVTVQGEKSETRTQTDTITPIKKPENLPQALPGYLQESAARPPEFDYLQKDQEQTLRQSGLLIKGLHATAILDSSVSESQANLVRQLLPDLLRLDANRGDILTVVRAPLLPPWRRMILGSDGMRIVLQDATRAVFWFLTALVLLAFMGAIGYFIAMRCIRAFVSEVGKVRGGAGGAAERQRVGGSDAGGRVEELPEVLPGGVPALAGDASAGDAGRVPALGRRFDFLAASPLADLAEHLAAEKPQDLALLFGYLADTHDSLASRVFAALPSDLQAEVSQHLSHLNMADPERLAMLESRLRTAMEFGIRGADRLGRILSRIPTDQREGILGEMMSRDPAAAEKVESSMIPFESLSELPDAQLRRLLTAVPYQEWGAALRGAPEELVTRVLALLPAEAQAALRDYLETPQPAEKVLEARSKVLSLAYTLAAQGVISIGGKSSQLM
jgi:hypothetical protein